MLLNPVRSAIRLSIVAFILAVGIAVIQQSGGDGAKTDTPKATDTVNATILAYWSPSDIKADVAWAIGAKTGTDKGIWRATKGEPWKRSGQVSVGSYIDARVLKANGMPISSICWIVINKKPGPGTGKFNGGFWAPGTCSYTVTPADLVA